MPEVDEKVMRYVEDVLKQSPDIALDDLYQRTRRVHASVGELSKRQFNGRYPLQVKRRRALAARGTRPPSKGESPTKVPGQRKATAPSGAPRDVVRQVLLGFATDIAAAEERKDLVRVLAGVDRYVDQVLKGVGKS